eukprot:923674-Rhodomonas_salina.1
MDHVTDHVGHGRYRQLFHNLKEYRRMKGANLESTAACRALTSRYCATLSPYPFPPVVLCPNSYCPMVYRYDLTLSPYHITVSPQRVPHEGR